MEFNQHKSIYLQICDMICERIMTDSFIAGERIPSVRELAIQLEVNPNTVMRTYELLQTLEIIYNKRGVGYFVSSHGKEKAFTYRKEDFIENELPVFMQNVMLLGILPEELLSFYQTYHSRK